MNIIEKIRQRILRFLRIDELPYNPNGERFTFVNDYPAELSYRVKEAEVWLKGDSNELLNFYTDSEIGAFRENPVYNRNRDNYFWAISTTEASIKRVHSGLPRAIVETLSNVVGVPKVSVGGEDDPEILRRIGFRSLVNQEQMPQTLGVGYGAFKVDVDPELSPDAPIVRFVRAENVEFVVEKGKDVGVIFKSYYQSGEKTYVLLETRRLDRDGSSLVEYELFRQEGRNQVDPVPLGEVPGLERLKGMRIPGYGKILAVPCRFFADPDNPSYGRSVFAGKYDLFDDLDQSLSQRSQTCRVSTPVEYYPADLLRTDQNGNPMPPKVYNRQYMQGPGGLRDGDGNVNASIITTQPELNFDQYTAEQQALVSQILIGILSPATMGIDVSKKDNAEAQREKEKVTIMTRDNVIAGETDIVRSLVTLVLDMDDYMKSGSIPKGERDIGVKFPMFANPTFEEMSKTLYPMWEAGAISTKLYVEKLYGDTLSDKEKAEEIAALESRRKEDAAQEFAAGFEDERDDDTGNSR